MSDRIRVGILGPGGIVARVWKDFDRAEGLELVAVGSRDLSRARQAAEKYGARLAFGSYEELAACPEVDLIYVATPHMFHMEHAILCMDHGKHVLVEKPMAVNDEQTEKMVACAKKNHVFLMEAMWTRLFPASYKIRELVADGKIGTPVSVSSDFCFYFKPDPKHRLFSLALAGGALLDVGIYTMAASTMVLGMEPSRVYGSCLKAETGADIWDSITMEYPGGAVSQQLIGFLGKGAQGEVIIGDKARIEVPDFWHPTRFTLVDNDEKRQEYRFDEENEGFRHEFMHVRECILKGLTESPVMPFTETLQLSRIMTKLRREWGVLYPEEGHTTPNT